MMTLRSRTLVASLIAASFALAGCGDNQFEQEVKLEQSAVQLAQEVGAMGAMAWSHTCYNGEVPPALQSLSARLRSGPEK